MTSVPSSANLLPRDGEALFFPAAFSAVEGDALLGRLIRDTAWRQEPIFLFGRWVDQPRLTACHGDPGSELNYSGITMTPAAWTPELLAIKERAEALADQRFTNALLNFYRDQRDSMGWHRDDERQLGPEPVIASVSFGATRAFHMRHYTDKQLKVTVDLPHGSVLVMRGAMQHCWEHCLPKRGGSIGPRLNITFRTLKTLRSR